MGSSTSKAARTASGVATRKYPSRIPPTGATTNTMVQSANAPPERQPTEHMDGSSEHPHAHIGGSENKALAFDASGADQGLNARLREMGPVQPVPTMSNSSTYHLRKAREALSSSSPQGLSFQPSASAPSQSLFPNLTTNPAVTLLAARSKFAAQAEREFDDVARLGKGKGGRRFLDVITIRQVLTMRDELGIEEGEIERRLGLNRGVVKMLGPRGMVAAASV